MSAARVTLLPDRQVLDVPLADSILEVALRAGIHLPHSCKGGHCGSCRARLLAGRIHYPSGRPAGLSDAEAAAGDVLLCQARPASEELTIEVRRIESRAALLPVHSVPCRIERMALLAPDVMGVWLRLPQTEPFDFVAGQYIDVLLPGQRRRSFSLANPPHDAALLELHVKRVRGGEFTQQLFASLHEKALLRIEGPFGQLALREQSPRPILFVAGGTGYAPLRAMLRQVLERGPERPCRLYWGVASRQDLYADAELRDRERSSASFRYVPVLSAPDPDGTWTGRTGLVHEAVLADHPDLAGFDVYAAGPPALIDAMRRDFTAAGLPADQLLFDSSDFAPDVLAKIKAAGTGGGTGG